MKKQSKNETKEQIEDVNKICRARHAELKKRFYESLTAAPINIAPDFGDNDVWTETWGLVEGSRDKNHTASWSEPEGQWADINTLMTRREQAYFDDKLIYCHLRARGWDLQKSLDMIRETLRWRREAKPWTVELGEIDHHLKSGKNYILGWTKKHQPTVIMRCRLDVPGDNPGKIRTILFSMERLLRLSRARNAKFKDCEDPFDLRDTPPHEQVSLIFDCKGFAKKDIDMALTKELAKTLDHYPETLGVVFAVDTPMIFRAFWKVARGFLDEKTVKKINFVSGEDGRRKIMPNYYEPEQLETNFGGANRFQYNHETYGDMLKKEHSEGISILEEPVGLGGDARKSSLSPQEADIDLDAGQYEAELEKEGEGEGEGDSEDSTPRKKEKKKDKK